MSDIEVKLIGNDEIIAALRGMREKLPAFAKKAALSGAQIILDAIYQRVPISPRPEVSGILASNFRITTHSGHDGVSARIVANARAYFWRFVEFGHMSRGHKPVAAAPFITPSVDGQEQAAAQEVIDMVGQLVNEAESNADRTKSY